MQNIEQQQKTLNKSIESLSAQKQTILQPLTTYCQQPGNHYYQMHSALKKLLTSYELTPKAIEKRLNLLIRDKDHEKQEYYEALIQCRKKTAIFTGNSYTRPATKKLQDQLRQNQKIMQLMMQKIQKLEQKNHKNKKYNNQPTNDCSSKRKRTTGL